MQSFTIARILTSLPLIVKYKGMVRNRVEWEPTKEYANKRRKWCRCSQSSTLPAPVSLHNHSDVRTYSLLDWSRFAPQLGWSVQKPSADAEGWQLNTVINKSWFIMCFVFISWCCSPPAFCLFIALLKTVFLFPSWAHVSIDALRAWLLRACEFPTSHWALSNFVTTYITTKDSKVKLECNCPPSPMAGSHGYKVWGITQG